MNVRTRLRKRLARLGEEPIGVAAAVITFVAIFTARNFAESVLEVSRALVPEGQVRTGAIDAFSHYPLFWIAVFLATCLHLHFWTRRPVPALLRTGLYFFPIILLPPIFDAVFFGGGWRLAYPRTATTVIFDALHWFDLDYEIFGVSPGIRIEVALVCLGFGAYVSLFSRSRWRLLFLVLAALSQFALIFAFAYWPGTIRDLSFHTAWAKELAAAQQMSAADVAFWGATFIRHSGKVYALSYLLLLLPLSSALLLFSRSPLMGAVLRNLRPSRAAHYLTMFGAGIAVGFAYHPDPPSLTHPGDYLVLGMLGLVVLLSFSAQVWLNDVFDRDADALDSPERPIPAGRVAPKSALLIALSLAGWSLWVAGNISLGSLFVVLTFHLLGFVYSAPPFRLKRWLGLAHGILGIESLLCFWLGAAAIVGLVTPGILPSGLSLAVFLCVTLGSTFKDLKDINGDRETGTYTLPVLLGERAGRVATGVVFAAACLLAPWLMGIEPNWLLVIIAATFLAGVAAIGRFHDYLILGYGLYGLWLAVLFSQQLVLGVSGGTS